MAGFWCPHTNRKRTPPPRFARPRKVANLACFAVAPAEEPEESALSPARDEAEEFDAVAIRECAGGPFIGTQRGVVVLDEHGAFGKAECGDECGDVGRGGFARLAVDADAFHRDGIDWSQSFHTASNPERRSSSAISPALRVSAISNWLVAA